MRSSPTVRWGLGVALLLVLGWVVYAAWQVWQVNRDLEDTIDHARQFEAALANGDVEAAEREISAIQEASDAAADRTSGATWSVLGVLPVLGDDARGIETVSGVVADLASDGLEPFVRVSDDLERLKPRNGVVPVDRIEALRDPVAQARAAVVEARERLSGEDPDGFVDRLASRYRELEDAVGKAAAAMESAEVAVEVLPNMLGADGPRDYLLLFQNNAEIRATGGMPGSWAQLHTDGGRIEMVQQGVAGAFPYREQPVVPLTDEELELYGEELGTFFQDPGFAPDFPRAGEIWRGHWDLLFPDTPIDGVLALDPVAMSYLLPATGPVQVGGMELTEANFVEEVLNRPYLELEPAAQDELFQDAARAIFDAMTSKVRSPVDLVEGLRRAAQEGRLLVAPFVAEDAEVLAGAEVLGALPVEQASTPYVDIGLNDLTASKMSYYLRYWAEVEATACREGRQQIEGTMTLSQVIPPSEAATLPDSVTGANTGRGFEPGTQIVSVRLYGPPGGTIESVRIDGRRVQFDEDSINGRPASTHPIGISTKDDVVISWTMDAGPDQTGDIRLRMTPGILPGDNNATFPSAC